MPPPPPPPKGVSEEELSGIASELEELGIEVPEELLSMIESFEELDTNSDGLLTRSEHEASIAGIEGTASKESLAITKADLENIATKIESAGGEVSNKLSSLLESFDSLDTNKDGQVTQEEMMAALKETKENTPEGGEKSDFLEQFGERFKEQKTNVPLRFFQEKMSAYSMFSQKAASNSTPEINLYQS
jgi:Ca2+-binding EF-hand superfamily protein